MFEDGPLELPDRTLWFKNGVLHRINGPAVEFKSGQKFWFLNGKELSEPEVIAHRQEMERQALELSDKVLEQHFGDVTVNRSFNVGHAIPPFKQKPDKPD